jgi:uncharacterized protein (TIGR02597 family)
MKKLVLSGIVILGTQSMIIHDASAQATGGAAVIRIRGSSDNALSLPYQRPPIDAGKVAAVNAQAVRLQGKNWTPDEYAYAADVQPVTHYAQFDSGPLEGVFYRILSNNADTLVLDTESDDLTNHPLGQVQFGDDVKIVPYWSVAEVFGATEAELVIEPRVSPLFPKDDVLLYDPVQIGFNKAPTATLYFRAGQGWRSVQNPNVDAGDTILPPGGVFVVRRRNAEGASLVNYGLFDRTRRVVFVQGGDGSRGNDHYASLAFPEPVTLDESNLGGTVVRPSSSVLLRADELLLWRSAPVGLNVPPNVTLFFHQADGWRRVGESAPVGSSFRIEPGEALIVRKKLSSPGTDWVQLPPP